MQKSGEKTRARTREAHADTNRY